MSDQRDARGLCSIKVRGTKPTRAGLPPGATSLIEVLKSKWLNGTHLKYCFLPKARFQLDDGSWETHEWPLDPKQLQAVRDAFALWKGVGIGLTFEEVNDPNRADVRIGFRKGDGAWSYVGTDVRNPAKDELTMNLGWDVSEDIDTAVHEIGHTLGFPHEHQNPYAGIEWDEEAVYKDLEGYPNYWKRDKTHYNIIRKIDPDTVQGSSWDPDSIMHYPFKKGLIKKPEQYRNGLQPKGGLSDRDKQWVKTFYPPLAPSTPEELVPYQSRQLHLKAGEQMSLRIKAATTRDYEIATFGDADTVMVLYELGGATPAYVAGDDDSGEERNARLKLRLQGGREYELRLRLYYAHEEGGCAVMCW